jgi:hypothetical protein
MKGRTFLYEQVLDYRLSDPEKRVVRHFFTIDEETIELMNKYLRQNKSHRSLVVFDLWEGCWVEYKTHFIRKMMLEGTEL